MRTVPTYLKTFAFVLILAVMSDTFGQAPMFDEYKYSSPESAIRFSNDSLKLRIKNGFCFYAGIFGVADTSNSSVILADRTFTVYDRVTAKTITGLSGSQGNTSYVLFSSKDSVHTYIYDYYYNLEDSSVTYFPDDNITVLRGSYPWYAYTSWLLLEHQDTARLMSWDDEPEVVLLGRNKSIRLFYNLDDQRYVHITGADENDSLRYYRFDKALGGSITHQYYIDTLPGKLLYTSGLSDTFGYFITSDSNVLYATKHLYNTDTFITRVLDTIDSVAIISNWFAENNPQIAAVKHIGYDSSLVYTYSIYDWSKLDTLASDLHIKKLLFGRSAFVNMTEYYNPGRVMIYRNDSGKLYLTYPKIDSNTISPAASSLQIPTDIVSYSVSYHCWIGIDEKELPPIQTYVYPNPATQYFNVLIKNVPCEREHHLQLLDMNGRLLYETPFYSKCDITIPAHDLAPGMYLLKLHIDGQVHTRKVIKATVSR